MTIRMDAGSGEFVFRPYSKGRGASSSRDTEYQSDYSETRSTRSRTRSRTHEEHYDERPTKAPRRRAAPKPQVRYIEAPDEQPQQVVVLRGRRPPPVKIIDQREPVQQHVQYVDDGYHDRYDDRGSHDEYAEPRASRSRPRYEEEFEPRASSRPRYEEELEPRTSRSSRSRYQEDIQEDTLTLKQWLRAKGPGEYPVDGRWYSVEFVKGRLEVFEIDGPTKDMAIERKSSPTPGKPDSKPAAGGFARTAARIASWGAVGFGAVLALGGVVGVATGGANMGSVIGRLWPNMQQAIWPIGFGAFSAGVGAVGLRATRAAKPA